MLSRIDLQAVLPTEITVGLASDELSERSAWAKLRKAPLLPENPPSTPLHPRADLTEVRSFGRDNRHGTVRQNRDRQRATRG